MYDTTFGSHGINVKIVLLNDKCLPQKKSDGDACFDLRSAVTTTIAPGKSFLVPLGIATSFSPKYFAEIRGRSGMDAKDYNVRLGTIDANYRGPWMANIKNNSNEPLHIMEGDRVAQVAFHEVNTPNFIEVLDLDESDRGSNGFGSSGLQ